MPSRLCAPILLLLGVLCAPVAHGEILIKNGEKIAFLGASITQAGWDNPAGYIHLVIAGLAANGVAAEPLPAGIGGQKSDQMLERLDKDVLSKHPQWMTLNCGINDVRQGAAGIPLDEAMAAIGNYDHQNRGTYKGNVSAIVQRAQAAGVKPVILISTVIQEDLDSPENLKLAPFNAFLRELCRKESLPMADLDALFRERIRAENKPGERILTVDGVHMNAAGDRLMARGVLQAFGLEAPHLKKAEEAWGK